VANFGDLQNEIYLAGLSSVVPSLAMSFPELERRAELALPSDTWSYVAGGAGDEHTQRNNRTAFDHWGLMPRMLRAKTERDLSVELFGTRFPTPIFLAPIGVIGICTQDGHGDLAAARAAATTGVPMVASTLSEDPLEDVAAQFGDTPGFFQLYCPHRSRGRGQPPSAGGGSRLPRDRRHSGHLGHWLAPAGPVHLELPAAAGSLPADVLLGPGLPEPVGEVARG